MTTKAEVLRAARLARDAAIATLRAVEAKRNGIYTSPTKWIYLSKANDMVELAEQNVTTIEALPGVLETALRSQDVGAALAQALVIVEQTGEATERYARYAERNELVELVGETWGVFVELVADLAYTVADAVLVVGKRAASGLGGAAIGIGFLAALGIFVAVRR